MASVSSAGSSSVIGITRRETIKAERSEHLIAVANREHRHDVSLRRACARSRPVPPALRGSGRGRRLRAEVFAPSGSLSTSRNGVPAFARTPPRTRPVGPAPTIKTSVLAGRLLRISLGARGDPEQLSMRLRLGISSWVLVECRFSLRGL